MIVATYGAKGPRALLTQTGKRLLVEALQSDLVYPFSNTLVPVSKSLAIEIRICKLWLKAIYVQIRTYMHKYCKVL